VCGFGCLFRWGKCLSFVNKKTLERSSHSKYMCIETETGIPNIFVGPLGFFHKYSPVINIRVFEKCPVPKIEGKTFLFYFILYFDIEK
jgi:hypothetical protein